MADNLDDISVGQDAIRRLEAINASVIALHPRVDDMGNVPPDKAMLQPLKDDLKDVMDLSKDVSTSRLTIFIFTSFHMLILKTKLPLGESCSMVNLLIKVRMS